MRGTDGHYHPVLESIMLKLSIGATICNFETFEIGVSLLKWLDGQEKTSEAGACAGARRNGIRGDDSR